MDHYVFKTTTRFFSFLLIISILFMGNSCMKNIGKHVGEKVQVALKDMEDTLDNGIARLEVNSSDWQAVLSDTSESLSGELRETVRADVDQLLQRGLGASGSEILCVVDSVPKRMLNGLKAIKAKLQKKDVPLVNPTLCQSVPDKIDLNNAPQTRNVITFYGYDILDSSRLSARLQKDDGTTISLVNRVQRVTDYQFSVNLSDTADPILSQHFQLTVNFEDTNQTKVLSELPILQAQVKQPEEKVITTTPPPLSYMPKHTGGDREYKRNGPHVTVGVKVHHDKTKAYIDICMRAIETKEDWTEARGCKEPKEFYTAPPGWHIVGLTGNLGKGTLEFKQPRWCTALPEIMCPKAWMIEDPIIDYVDVDTSDDDHFEAIGKFVITGDTSGDDAGVKTQVKIENWRPYKITIREN